MKLSATLTTSLLLFSLESLSAPSHDEAYYSDRFCKEREGVSEVILEDLSRVDT